MWEKSAGWGVRWRLTLLSLRRSLGKDTFALRPQMVRDHPPAGRGDSQCKDPEVPKRDLPGAGTGRSMQRHGASKSRTMQDPSGVPTGSSMDPLEAEHHQPRLSKAQYGRSMEAELGVAEKGRTAVRRLMCESRGRALARYPGRLTRVSRALREQKTPELKDN